MKWHNEWFDQFFVRCNRGKKIVKNLCKVLNHKVDHNMSVVANGFKPKRVAAMNVWDHSNYLHIMCKLKRKRLKNHEAKELW